MRFNPMVKKDIKVQARSMRICWEIFVYEAIMAVVFFFAMFLFSQQMTYSSANIYSSIVWLYPALAVTQIFILGVVVPVRTASAISGEKERQTFDIMMTTSMTGFSIIMGKVITAMIQSMFYVVAGASDCSTGICHRRTLYGAICSGFWQYHYWFRSFLQVLEFCVPPSVKKRSVP